MVLESEIGLEKEKFGEKCNEMNSNLSETKNAVESRKGENLTTSLNSLVNIVEKGNSADGIDNIKGKKIHKISEEIGGDNDVSATLKYEDNLLDTKNELPKKKKRKNDDIRSSCPYLGTINRHMLDFDFEKLCSISMSNHHVYACLVCGKYFQGRGKNTYCYIHSLEDRHHVFINLSNCKVYCLPDNYAVQDASLDDIRFFLNPTYTEKAIKELNKTVVYGKALDGTDFLPGCIGLNNLKQTDCCNVIIQLLCTIAPMRNFLLGLDLSKEQNADPILMSLSDLVKKMYNPKNFKGIVSPHEFLQAVGVESNKKFRIGVQSDPLSFFSWLFRRIHIKTKSKKSGSIVTRSIEGEVLTTKCSVSESGEVRIISEDKNKFLFLTLLPPPTPIFKDSLDRNMIPQVPIFDLLQKFDGETMQEINPGDFRKYSMWKLPPYLIFSIKRFSKNNFFVEKNPTIVTFPVKNLDLRDYVHPDALDLNPVCRYNLVANVCHQGKPHGGFYKIYVLHMPTNEWYEIEDLRVIPVLPQYVALSESYVQVYQRNDLSPDGNFDEIM